ncbi:MAG: hypothetical protein QF357_08790, partial [Dehalococcoidia bacterium]|nr:hypothetical protein [Dehalococcoidia bacterium]
MKLSVLHVRSGHQPNFAIFPSVVGLLALVATACGGDGAEPEPFDPVTSALAILEFSSPAFDDGDSIPVEFTCDGDGSSPPLRWSEPPSGAKALAIVVDDPDAPRRVFRHW